MHTEDEARKKWCFECAKSPLSDETERYGPHDGVIGARCLASDCMAWRWVEPPGPRPPDAPERDERGYCGLAPMRTER